jgi:hypothetical protein
LKTLGRTGAKRRDEQSTSLDEMKGMKSVTEIDVVFEKTISAWFSVTTLGAEQCRERLI